MANLTIKQEKFCHIFIETGNASEAYRQAYNAEKMTEKSVHETAAQLMSNLKVASRVEELRAEHAKRHAVTVDSITLELEAARIMAMGDDVQQASAAVNAAMSKAKLHGLIVERRENDNTNTNTNANIDIKEGDDPKEALRSFEAFRRGLK